MMLFPSKIQELLSNALPIAMSLFTCQFLSVSILFSGKLHFKPILNSQSLFKFYLNFFQNLLCL